MIKFTKSVATGNDFIIIDNRQAVLKNNLSAAAKKTCGTSKRVNGMW